MANNSHVFFYFYPLCNRCHTHAQQKAKTVSNDARLMRIGGSQIVICFIQREAISVNFIN